VVSGLDLCERDLKLLKLLSTPAEEEEEGKEEGEGLLHGSSVCEVEINTHTNKYIVKNIHQISIINI